MFAVPHALQAVHDGELESGIHAYLMTGDPGQRGSSLWPQATATLVAEPLELALPGGDPLLRSGANHGVSDGCRGLEPAHHCAGCLH